MDLTRVKEILRILFTILLYATVVVTVGGIGWYILKIVDVVQ